MSEYLIKKEQDRDTRHAAAELVCTVGSTWGSLFEGKEAKLFQDFLTKLHSEIMNLNTMRGCNEIKWDDKKSMLPPQYVDGLPRSVDGLPNLLIFNNGKAAKLNLRGMTTAATDDLKKKFEEKAFKGQKVYAETHLIPILANRINLESEGGDPSYVYYDWGCADGPYKWIKLIKLPENTDSDIKFAEKCLREDNKILHLDVLEVVEWVDFSFEFGPKEPQPV